MRVVALHVIGAAAAGRDHLAMIEELAADADRLVEQPARIEPEIEYDASELTARLRLQLLESLGDLLGALLLELRQADVGDRVALEP